MQRLIYYIYVPKNSELNSEQLFQSMLWSWINCESFINKKGENLTFKDLYKSNNWLIFINSIRFLL